jgi:hypothetical protein
MGYMTSSSQDVLKIPDWVLERWIGFWKDGLGFGKMDWVLRPWEPSIHMHHPYGD